MLASPMVDTAGANGSAAGSASSATTRLEEARMLVRARRQEAKDRAAAAAAEAAEAAAADAQAAAQVPATAESVGGGDSDAGGAGQRPVSTAGTGSSTVATRSRVASAQVDVAARGLKSSRFRTTSMRTRSNESTGGRVARGYSPRGRPGATGRGFKSAAGRGGGGGAMAGGTGVKRRRVLPDFTKVTEAAAAAPVVAPPDREEDAALVGTIRATLQQTIAEVGGRKYTAPSSSTAGGTLPSSSTRQVRRISSICFGCCAFHWFSCPHGCSLVEAPTTALRLLRISVKPAYLFVLYANWQRRRVENRARHVLLRRLRSRPSTSTQRHRAIPNCRLWPASNTKRTGLAACGWSHSPGVWGGRRRRPPGRNREKPPFPPPSCFRDGPPGLHFMREAGRGAGGFESHAIDGAAGKAGSLQGEGR